MRFSSRDEDFEVYSEVLDKFQDRVSHNVNKDQADGDDEILNFEKEKKRLSSRDESSETCPDILDKLRSNVKRNALKRKN